MNSKNRKNHGRRYLYIGATAEGPTRSRPAPGSASVCVIFNRYLPSRTLTVADVFEQIMMYISHNDSVFNGTRLNHLDTKDLIFTNIRAL